MLSSFLLATRRPPAVARPGRSLGEGSMIMGSAPGKTTAHEVARSASITTHPSAPTTRGLARGSARPPGCDRSRRAHFRRLGLDPSPPMSSTGSQRSVRATCWTTKNLKLFDYLVFSAKQRWIYTGSPRSWWHYLLRQRRLLLALQQARVLRSPAARSAQKNYLRQFMEHVNP
jgi:hypothetical protein